MCIHAYVYRACAIFLREVDRLLGNFAAVYARCNCGEAVHRERSNGFAATTVVAVGDIPKFAVFLSLSLSLLTHDTGYRSDKITS